MYILFFTVLSILQIHEVFINVLGLKLNKNMFNDVYPRKYFYKDKKNFLFVLTLKPKDLHIPFLMLYKHEHVHPVVDVFIYSVKV